MTFTYVLTYFIVALTCASVAIVILLQLNTELGTEREIRAFAGYVGWYLLFVLSNAIWVWINYGFLDWPGTPFSIVNLVSICTASYYWYTFVELRLSPSKVATMRFKVLSLLPLAVAILLILTTPATGLVFSYSPDNEYLHGPLYSTMAILGILYLVIATIHLFIHRATTRSPLQRRQYLVLMLFLIFPGIAGIIDVIVPNLPIMELMLLFGTVLVYTNMQQSQIYNDVLTGLNNRRLTDEYLLDQIAQCSDREPVYFMLGDADQFKAINDQHGHVEGDRALKLIAEGLKTATAGVRCHLARWGGDEFAIVLGTHANIAPNDLIARANKELERLVAREMLSYPLHLSFGYAKCTDAHAAPNDLLMQADKHMYLAKEQLHSDAA